jgi:uncharacterized membrane protein
MLPLNLFIYSPHAYDDDIGSLLQWSTLVAALAIVIGAIGTGLAASAYYRSRRFNLYANTLGNVAGILLICFSAVVSSSDATSRIW